MLNWLRRHPIAAFTLTVLLTITLSGFSAYQSWFVAGPWQTLPAGEAPRYSEALIPRFEKAGEFAIEKLAAHRSEHGFPAITAAVAYNGALIWQGGAGWQTLAPPTPVHPETQFRIGSTSKALTATAAARLIDRGVLNLDTPIEHYFPDPPNPAWRALTLRQLFSHTAGMPGYAENTDYHLYLTLCGCRHYDRVVDSLEIFDASEMLFEPGTDFHYSSFDTNLIGAVIARQQQTPYVDVLRNEVFLPLSLSSSGADRDGTPRPKLATFYDIRDGKAGVWPDFDLSQRWPGGGLVSTSAELARIGNAWLDPTFIHPATRDAMWTPQALSNGEINEQSYALGWRFNPERESNGRTLSYAHHGGVSKGAMSWLVVYPEHHLSIAVNINTRAPEFRDFARVEPMIREVFLAVILHNDGHTGSTQ